MKTSKRIVFIPIIMLFTIMLALGGCTTSKKPMTPSPPAQKPKVTTPAPSYPKATADRVVIEAKKVQGVRGATAVISGRNIYVGLDLNANLSKNKSAEVERTVLDRVKKLEPSYTVSVSADVDTVTRIKNISKGIAQGKPISSFSKEIQNIGTRMKPRMK